MLVLEPRLEPSDAHAEVAELFARQLQPLPRVKRLLVVDHAQNRVLVQLVLAVDSLGGLLEQLVLAQRPVGLGDRHQVDVRVQSALFDHVVDAVVGLESVHH